MYFTYVLRLSDQSLYTGITTDLARRMQEHADGGKKGAKYTRHRTFLRLEAAWKSQTRADASRLEWAIKHLKKETKERLCASPLLVHALISTADPALFCALQPEEIARVRKPAPDRKD